MSEKIALVTGANAGIGKYTVVGLVKRGIKVIMAVRNIQKGEEAKNEIIRNYEKANLVVLHCDLASLESVKQFSGEVHKKFDQVDILVNNAGAFFTKYIETEDGLERQWQINHLSHFMLTHLIFDLIKNSPEARIINVSSSSHYRIRIHFDDPNFFKNYKGVKAYAQSKLANILFSKALSRRLDPNHVTANSLHPGTIRTSIGNKNNNGLPALAWNLYKPFMKSIEKGAETSIFLATDETLKGVTGKYFDNKRSVSPNRVADNVDIQEKLWVLSLNQTGIEDKISN